MVTQGVPIVAELLAILCQPCLDVFDDADQIEPYQQMGGRSDPDVAAVCQRKDRALVTLDLDFSDIRAYPPADFAGIIVLRLARLDKQRILAAVQRLLPVLDQEPLTGKLWIVDEATVRIRS